ncbi:MAG TPA: alpha-E domain-containing protein, partial [Magnetospirillum sp.]|nr:alpha-E domain-containing protein [Magnetospirillum sp.]
GEAVAGLAMENMTRGPLWLFLDTGRRVERAITIVDTFAGALTGAETEHDVPLDLLLEISDSTMTYRSRYLAAPRVAGVMDLLLSDDSNPRSLAFQLDALEDHMNRLAAQAGGDGFLRPEQRQMTVLCGITRTLEIPVLATFDHDGGYHDAERLLETLRSRLWGLSELLSRQYFTHAQWRLPTASMDVLP